MRASGQARASNGGKVRFTANTDLGLNPNSGINNVNHLSISYTGPGSITSIVFNPEGDAAHGGNTTGGNNGLDLTNTYFSNVYPGLVFAPNTKAFTVGDLSDVSSGDVTATFSNQAPAPSASGQFWTMTLTFPSGVLSGGKALRFTVGRGTQHSSTVTNGIGPTGGTTSIHSHKPIFSGTQCFYRMARSLLAG